MAFAFSIWRFRAWRGQPAKALPSGVMTSQTTRATFPFECDHGKMRNVSRSGTRPMSDSSMRVKPSIEDPSNWISPSSAFSNCERGTSTFLMIPRMSVNCRRRNRTPSLSQVFRISAAFTVATPHPFFLGFRSRPRRIGADRWKVNPNPTRCTQTGAGKRLPDSPVLFSTGGARRRCPDPRRGARDKISAMNPSRATAWAVLTEFTKTQSLRRHALAVEATMRHLARSSGVTDAAEIETWGLVGMLHDFDYEKYPTEQDHVWRGMEILRERGWPEEIIRAVGGHAFYTNIERKTPMEKAILAADELTGFAGACALIRPTKKIADVPVESVVKRLKEKSFARSVDRNYVTRGAEEWRLPLPELVALVLAAQVPIADRIGLGGAPAADLADTPVPPEPPAP